MSNEATHGAERCPAASAGVGIVVEPLPGELRAGGTVARAVANVELRLDGAKDEFAAVLADEREVCGFEEINVFLLIHLGDPPPPRKGPSEGRSAPGHIDTAISFGARTRL